MCAKKGRNKPVRLIHYARGHRYKKKMLILYVTLFCPFKMALKGKMPRRADCNLRRELLEKEERIERLHQTKRWVDQLGRQEPHHHQEVKTKQDIVVAKLVQIQTLAESGVLVNKLAAGCRNCNDD